MSDHYGYTNGRAWLLNYLKKYRGQLLLGMLLELTSMVFNLQVPRLVGRAIDGLRQAGVTHDRIWQAALMVVGVSIVGGVFTFFQRRTLINMSRHIEYDLRQDVYAHLQRLPLEFYQGNRIGDLMARMVSDLGSVRAIVGQAIIYSAQALFRVLIILPLMFLISVKLTLLLLLTMPLVTLTVKFFGQRIHSRFGKVQEFFADINARVQQNLSGVRVIRAYGQEGNELAEFDRLNRQYVERNLNLVRLSAVFRPLLMFCVGLGIAAILWVGGRETALGRMSVGDFVAFTLYFEQLVWPLMAIGHVTNFFQRGTASLKRLHRVMSTEPSINDAPGVRPAPGIKGRVELRGLTFRYAPDGPAALRDINLVIEPGTTVALIGRTGSGKSTLANIIPRLLDAEPGMVLIDGRPIRDIPLRQLRENIGYVPQETYLFGESLAGNIAFGAPAARAAEIEWAADVAGLTDDVGGFPQGFQTIVGERGVTLSGGQRQRTAIARAVIVRPKILILDDALSAVDADTEERVLSLLRDVMRDRTTLIVSHRILTIRDADLICVLDHGRIVERGTHEELMRAGGEYADLYEQQSLEEELAAG